MKRIVVFLFWMTSLLTVTAGSPSPDRLVGKWELDVARTQQARREIKKLPPGMDVAPKAGDVVARTILFTRETMTSRIGSNETVFYYTVFRAAGDDLYVKYQPSRPGEPPVFTHWVVTGSDTLTNYLIVFSAQEPLLDDTTVATYYKRAK